MHGANCIALYRAARFPDRWTREYVLLESISGYDATIVEKGGRWWLLVTTSRWQSSSSDNLMIYSASSLAGPWKALPESPQLIDARAARSAGAIWSYQGKMFRPAQDCSRVYGGGLSLCRIDVLDGECYEQTIIGRITATSGKAVLGCHTFNAAGNIEAIDVFGDISGLQTAFLSVDMLTLTA
jgi:hypothetical protein